MTITNEGFMGVSMTEAEWDERASRYLKAELKRAGITYDGLANLLKKQGFRDETKASVSSKLARGRFTETFFLASLGAIGNTVTNSSASFKKGIISGEQGIRMQERFHSTKDIDKVSMVCSMPLMGDVRTLSHY